MSPQADALAFFPQNYFAARDNFLALARHRGAAIGNHAIQARGPRDEPLTIDTAYLGAATPTRLLLILSGTHGIEGFAGSALQQQWLTHADRTALPPDGGCLLVHAVNPYGFAWRRRTNENNVDLNRNALASFPGPANPAYRHLSAWLNPTSARGFADFFLLKGVTLLARHGFDALQQAIVEGQYEEPRGLFYGGTRTEESLRLLFSLLGEARWRDLERVVAIDIHTGVGRFGTYKLMVDYAEASTPYRQLARWFGADIVASNQPKGSIAYRVSGGVTERLAKLLGSGRTYAGVLEFGTVAAVRLIRLLREENRLFHYARSTSARERVAAALQEAFCPNDPEWCGLVLLQGERALRQAEAACFAPT